MKLLLIVLGFLALIECIMLAIYLNKAQEYAYDLNHLTDSQINLEMMGITGLTFILTYYYYLVQLYYAC